MTRKCSRKCHFIRTVNFRAYLSKNNRPNTDHGTCAISRLQNLRYRVCKFLANFCICANCDRYQNGSLLIATLQPRFTILHNLTTSRAPSPIVTLAWHASSSKQKSDMLASQTSDGDLRVWSIAKNPTSSDTAKVVRVLKRSENFHPGANWLGWSKNGRIVQYSEG
jgi:hypothetical protein